MEDIHSLGIRNVEDTRRSNRELIEKALHMRCVSYLARIKEQLLLETIYEIDSSKKNLARIHEQVLEQNMLISSQKNQLEEALEALEKLRNELEERVCSRTAELEHANEQLKREMEERKKVEEEKRLYQEQLLHAQKMESIGRLAGGVAHDFNNLLTAILGYCELAMTRLEPSHPLQKDLTVIFEAGEKGASLIRHLLAFSRKQDLEMKTIQLNSLVEDMARILRRMLGRDIQVETNLEPVLFSIFGDVVSLEQVLLNLAVNARDAMPSGGRLMIETANIRLGTDYTKLRTGLEPGDYVMLAVTDSGEGMSQEVQSHIFEPFFTTKEKGKGTGLGLATVHGVVTQHKGHIFVYSEKNLGTTFKIYFKATDTPRVSQKPGLSPLIPLGNETVLVVDDEPAIRQLVADTLLPLGYTVIEADSGPEALALAHSGNTPIHLLLSDVIMPLMNGRELHLRFNQEFPGLPVLLMSGYTDAIIAKYAGGEPVFNFLQKPFSPSQLAVKVRNTLDGK